MARMNQRDQAQAYRFLTRRQSSALVRDDPDSPDAPMRKLAVASFGSVMLALLAVAGVGIFGVVRPGGATSWKNGQAVILEKETGTRYLYLGGVLHPVLNYASARLALAQPTFSMVSVSAASLSGTPRGSPIGIVGAPDELPTPASLVAGPWSVCSLPAQNLAGGISPYVRLAVGAGVPAVPGTSGLVIGAAAAGAALAVGRGLLVAGPDGTVYLVWNDQRLRIPGGQASLAALGYGSPRMVLVGDAWLSALPQGPDLAPPAVPGIGTRGTAVAGRRSRVGQVFTTGTGGAAGGGPGPGPFYLAEVGGLAPLSPLQAALMLADPATRRLYPNGRPAAITVPAAAVAPVAIAPAGASGLPARPPPLLSIASGQVALCTVYTANGSFTPTVRTIPVPASAMPQAPATAPSGPLGTPLADQVQLPPGDGALVQASAGPQAPGGTIYVITSEGIEYPVSSASLLSSLGLAGIRPVRVPDVVLSLLRTGPTLDRHAAMQPVSP